MSSAGPVAFADVIKQYDGRSKGCGIVEYTNAEDAKKALETLHDSTLDGRTIFIREVTHLFYHSLILSLTLVLIASRIEMDQTQERESLNNNNSRTLLLVEATTVHGPRTKLPTEETEPITSLTITTITTIAITTTTTTITMVIVVTTTITTDGQRIIIQRLQEMKVRIF